MSESKESFKKIPYRPITFIDLELMLDKYKGKTNREIACKLMVDEELLILRKENEPITDTSK